MKKSIFLSLTILSILAAFFSFPLGLRAQGCTGDICPEDQRGGFVPCARMCDDPNTTEVNETCPCTLCSFFVMFNTILVFVFFRIVPIVVTLMIVISGAMFIFATGSPATLETAKKTLTSVVLGVIVVYSAFLIIGLFLMAIGLEEITWAPFFSSWWSKGFFEINCRMP